MKIKNFRIFFQFFNDNLNKIIIKSNLKIYIKNFYINNITNLKRDEKKMEIYY